MSIIISLLDESLPTQEPVTSVEASQVRTDMANLLIAIVIGQIEVIANSRILSAMLVCDVISHKGILALSKVLIDESTAVTQVFMYDVSSVLVKRGYLLRYSK